MTDLKAMGVFRDAENDKAIGVCFNRAPTDEELRAIHTDLSQQQAEPMAFPRLEIQRLREEAQQQAEPVCIHGNAGPCVECDAAREGQPAQEPFAWITSESLDRLSKGGNNSRATVPIHARRSAVADIPIYAAPPATQQQADPYFLGLAHVLLKALKRLSFAAQTACGTSGLDTDLVDAIAEAERAIEKSKGYPQQQAEPRCDAGYEACDCRGYCKQQQAEPVDAGPWSADGSDDGTKAWVDSHDFTHDVRLNISGDFADGKQRFAYAEEIARRLNAAPPAVQASVDLLYNGQTIKLVPAADEAVRKDAERYRHILSAPSGTVRLDFSSGPTYYHFCKPDELSAAIDAYLAKEKK